MQPIPKPSKEAQTQEEGAKKVLLSDVYATAKTKLFGRPWNGQDYGYVVFMTIVHGLCLLAPFTFSWQNVALFFGTYFITGSPPPLQVLVLCRSPLCRARMKPCCCAYASDCLDLKSWDTELLAGHCLRQLILLHEAQVHEPVVACCLKGRQPKPAALGPSAIA